MPIAYYFDIKRGHEGSLNRIGGQPTHLPTSKPWPDSENDYWCFLLQLQAIHPYVPQSDTAFLQFYQPIDEGDDPTPVVLKIPNTAELNTRSEVLACPYLDQWSIWLTKSNDPDTLPDLKDLDTAKIMKSKFGGLDPWCGSGEFVLQISEGLVGFNFGGAMCSLYRRGDELQIETN